MIFDTSKLARRLMFCLYERRRQTVYFGWLCGFPPMLPLRHFVVGQDNRLLQTLPSFQWHRSAVLY